MPYKDPKKRREYGKRHYTSNREKYKTSRTNYRIALRDEVNGIKEARGCSDCKIPYPYYILDFDHREGVDKVHKINSLIRSANREDVMAEIAKCDVVCANCHRIRTFTRLKSDPGEN